MITLCMIGLLVLIFRIVLLAVKAAWGITRTALYLLGLPVVLIGLLAIGLAKLALPLLIIGLIAAFLLPKTDHQG